MRDMTIHDIQQKFEGSVVLYEKRPVVFKKVGGDFSVRIFDMVEQKEEQVDFDMKKFAPPPPRIGFVNLSGSVVYVSRIPVRRYKLGLSKENLKTDVLSVKYPDGSADFYCRQIQSLDRKELAYALLNKYPTLREAVRRVSQFQGAMAFDKQFAINHHQEVFYKTQKVGVLDGLKVVFNEGFEHLQMLLRKV